MHSCRASHILRPIALLLLACLPTIPGSAQTTDGEATDAPLVSRMRLSVRDSQIRVSWEEAEAPVAEYLVYRAGQPITSETVGEAIHVGTVDGSERAYMDSVAEPGDYYYAVVAVDPDGTAHPIIVPDRNASDRPVTIESVATPAEGAARVVRLDWALVERNERTAIEISLVADREGRTVAVYRSTRALSTTGDLEHATLVGKVDSGTAQLIDLPVPGVEYYYAALDVETLLSGRNAIHPGENATLDPAEIPLERAAEIRVPERIAGATIAGVRRAPLPLLDLQYRLTTGRRLRDPRALVPRPTAVDPETEQRISELLERTGVRRGVEPAPAVLAEDRLPEPQGAEYTLRTIIDGPFRRRAWEEAIVQLENYFTLPLPPDLAARAHFYRAQAYYFTGERQQAILEFVLAREHHYVEVRSWLDHLLSPAR